jgi:hypothetical protein
MITRSQNEAEAVGDVRMVATISRHEAVERIIGAPELAAMI